jgi:hypothetical protein
VEAHELEQVRQAFVKGMLNYIDAIARLEELGMSSLDAEAQVTAWEDDNSVGE